MEKSKLQEWLDALGKVWVDQEPENIKGLLAKDVKYFENVLDDPIIGLEKVYNLWKVVPENQKDVTFEGEVVMIEGKSAIANWHVTRTKIPSGEKEIIDGIFLFELNDEGKCTLFKQWRTSRIV